MDDNIWELKLLSGFVNRSSNPPTKDASLQVEDHPTQYSRNTAPAEYTFLSRQIEQITPVDHTRKLWQTEYYSMYQAYLSSLCWSWSCHCQSATGHPVHVPLSWIWIQGKAFSFRWMHTGKNFTHICIELMQSQASSFTELLLFNDQIWGFFDCGDTHKPIINIETVLNKWRCSWIILLMLRCQIFKALEKK